MSFQPPRILTDSEQNTIRGKCLVGHATPEEVMSLISHFDLMDMRLRGALSTLSGCLPDTVYVYGKAGERWSEEQPDDEDDFETINFGELLD